MPDERNHTEEILDRIRTGSALSDSRGRKITLPDPQNPKPPNRHHCPDRRPTKKAA